MRVACIAASRVPSRTANSIQVMKVAQAMVDLGHEVRLWLPEAGQAAGAKRLAQQYGLHSRIPIRRLRALPVARRYDFALAAAFAARAWRPDLVYAWPMPAAAISARLHLPTLLEMHDVPAGILGAAWFRSFLRAPGARRVIPITRALLLRLQQMFPRWQHGPAALVLPMGVDLERYRPLPSPAQARRRLGLEEAITAVYSGQLYPGRGMEILLALAVAQPEVRFLWVGGEPSAIETWKHRVEETGCRNIRLVGFVDHQQLHLYQAAGDILLMPYETHVSGSSGGDTARFASPMKMFEYLAAGRAILSSDLPVLREVLHEGIAHLVPAEQASAWDRALRGLARDATRRARLGRAARRAAVRYTWRGRTKKALAGLL